MRKRTELDERQLWQRGNVFKHAFVFLLAALALEALCKAFGITWAEGPWEAVLLIWASVALCWWEFILRDIYPMGRSQKGFFFAMGLCGVCIVVMELASLAAGRGPLLEEGALTSAGANEKSQAPQKRYLTFLAGAEGLEPSARGFGVDVGERTREREKADVIRFPPQVPERAVLVWCCELFLEKDCASTTTSSFERKAPPPGGWPS